LKVLVAACHAPVLDMIASASVSNDHLVFETAETVEIALLKSAEDQSYDAILQDFDMAGLNGLKGVHTLVQRCGSTPLVVLMTSGSLELAQRVIGTGAAGVLPRVTAPDALPHALALIAAQERVVVLDSVRMTSVNATAAQLSERELQVLRGLCNGLQNKEIAHAFAVQEVTVKMHVRAIIRKLNARNRTHAAMIARDQNLV